jgi:hypothetical protein
MKKIIQPYNFFALKKDCNVPVLTAYIFTYSSAKKVLKTCPVRWIGRNRAGSFVHPIPSFKPAILLFLLTKHLCPFYVNIFFELIGTFWKNRF